jgi:site-specific DNA-cytosine methylase
VDDLIASLDELLAKNRDIKRGAMQQLLAGKTRLPGFGHGSHPTKHHDIGGLPEGWQVVRLGDLGARSPNATVGGPFADTINPTFIAWENVKNALSVQNGSVFGQFLGALAGSGRELRPPAGAKWGHAGYVVGPRRIVAWRLFDAQYGGVAQRRERLFVVGCPRTSSHDPRDILFEREGACRNHPPSHPHGKEQVHAATALGGVVYVNGDSRPKFSTTTAHTLKAASGNGGRACVAYRDADGAARVRELTPVEWERLQGFPDGWTDIEWRGGRAPKTLRQKALGNSLAIPDVRWIGERIKASVEGELACHHWPDMPRLGGFRRSDGFGSEERFYHRPIIRWAEARPSRKPFQRDRWAA